MTNFKLASDRLLICQNSFLWLKSIVDSSDDAIISINIDENIVSWNFGAENIYGYTALEMIGRSMSILLPPDRPDEISKLFARIKKGERIAHFETSRICKSGNIVDVSKTISPIKDTNAHIIGASIITRDITERKRIQAEIAKKNSQMEEILPKLQLAEKIFECANDGIVVTNSHGLIVMVNPAFLKSTGYKPDELLGFSFEILRSEYHDEAFYFDLWKVLKQEGHWTGEIWNKRKSGERYPEWLSISTIYDDTGDIAMYSAIYRDLTERLQYEKKIRHLAFHDALTGLPNRLLFQEQLEQALLLAKRNHKSVALLFLDIDGFKQVNDFLGHDAGDRLLQMVAIRLLSAVRSSDTVARMGGDEFTLILPEIYEKGEAAAVAEKLLRTIRKPFIINEHTLFVTLSIGISLFPLNGQDVQTLMKQADIAMYVTKNSYKDNYHFYSEDD
jgi:diguanylate cyclase (GGDEF)-like protein/PAS domain S-box-containing protein